MAAGQTQDDAKLERVLGPDSLFGRYAEVEAVAATGTVITDAAALGRKSFTLSVVSAADDAKGVRLPVPLQDGHVHFVKSTVSNKILKVWPHGATAINALSASAAISLASGPTIAMFIWDATSGKWWTLPLLPS